MTEDQRKAIKRGVLEARKPSNRLPIMAKKKKNTGIPHEKLVLPAEWR
jgi:hypothetical protein